MKSTLRIFSLELLCVFSAGLIAACGGSDDGGSSSGGSSPDTWDVDLNGGGGTGGGSGATVVDTGEFPDNIDVKVCAHLVETSENYQEFSSTCDACCSAAGFADSSSIYKDQCTCGNLGGSRKDEVVCASAQDGQSCGECCIEASYFMGLSSDGCACLGYEDAEICAHAIHDENDPSEACGICCLQQGSMGMSYMMGARCSCSF